MIRKKPGVSLEKDPGRTVMHDPRPLDLDPVVQLYSGWVLIVGVRAGSDGQGGLRRRRRRNSRSAVARGRGVAGVGQTRPARARFERGYGLGVGTHHA